MPVLAADGSAGARAWAVALRAQRALADPEAGVEPNEAALEELARAGTDAREPASLACAHAARARLLSLDPDGLERIAALHRTTGDEGWAAVTAGWAHALSHAGGETRAAADVAHESGNARGDAALVLEAASLRAAAALVGGDLDAALTLARRASRMARTESIPQEEYLANLLLARVRRLTGKPHLGTLILSALLRVASPPWRPWLTWELLLAQGTGSTGVPELAAGRAERATTALASMLDRAWSGDADGYRAACDDAIGATFGHGLLAHDVDMLAAAIDPRVVPSEGSALAAWCAGESDEVPDGLHGVCPTGGSAVGAPEAAFVFAAPDERPRRMLAIGLGLARVTLGADALPAAKGRQARTESTLAALALAGTTGIAEEELFRRVYGFAYDPVMHRGVRDVLYHRVRERIGNLGRLERGDGVARLVLDARVLVPDPRSSPPPEHQILVVLARVQHASAKDAAQALGIPLRTAQEALGRLAEDGACHVEKKGKKLEYRLEDTTFAEPTRF